jgi:hypothetical protein
VEWDRGTQRRVRQTRRDPELKGMGNIAMSRLRIGKIPAHWYPERFQTICGLGSS